MSILPFWPTFKNSTQRITLRETRLVAVQLNHIGSANSAHTDFVEDACLAGSLITLINNSLCENRDYGNTNSRINGRGYGLFFFLSFLGQNYYRLMFCFFFLFFHFFLRKMFCFFNLTNKYQVPSTKFFFLDLRFYLAHCFRPAMPTQKKKNTWKNKSCNKNPGTRFF